MPAAMASVRPAPNAWRTTGEAAEPAPVLAWLAESAAPLVAEATGAVDERETEEPDWERERPDEDEAAADETEDEAADDDNEAAAEDERGAAALRTMAVVLVMPIEPTISDVPVSAFLYCGRPKAPGMSVRFQPCETMLGYVFLKTELSEGKRG